MTILQCDKYYICDNGEYWAEVDIRNMQLIFNYLPRILDRCGHTTAVSYLNGLFVFVIY